MNKINIADSIKLYNEEKLLTPSTEGFSLSGTLKAISLKFDGLTEKIMGVINPVSLPTLKEFKKANGNVKTNINKSVTFSDLEEIEVPVVSGLSVTLGKSADNVNLITSDIFDRLETEISKLEKEVNNITTDEDYRLSKMYNMKTVEQLKAYNDRNENLLVEVVEAGNMITAKKIGELINNKTEMIDVGETISKSVLPVKMKQLEKIKKKLKTIDIIVKNFVEKTSDKENDIKYSTESIQYLITNLDEFGRLFSSAGHTIVMLNANIATFIAINDVMRENKEV